MSIFRFVRNLIAEVRVWKYRVTIFPDPDEPAKTGRFLYLECRTSAAHFLPYSTELFLRISEEYKKPDYNKVIMARPGDDRSQEGLELGDITYSSSNYKDVDSDEKIPAYLEGYFKISSEPFQHILDILNNAKGNNFLKVTLHLSIYGLDLGCKLEMDKWPDEKTLSIVNVEFCLEPRRHDEDSLT